MLTPWMYSIPPFSTSVIRNQMLGTMRHAMHHRLHHHTRHSLRHIFWVDHISNICTDTFILVRRGTITPLNHRYTHANKIAHSEISLHKFAVKNSECMTIEYTRRRGRGSFIRRCVNWVGELNPHNLIYVSTHAFICSLKYMTKIYDGWLNPNAIIELVKVGEIYCIIHKCFPT